MWPEPFQNETALGSPSPLSSLSPFFHPWEQCKPERRNPLLAVLRAQEKRDAYEGFRVGPMAFLRAWGKQQVHGCRPPHRPGFSPRVEKTAAGTRAKRVFPRVSAPAAFPDGFPTGSKRTLLLCPESPAQPRRVESPLSRRTPQGDSTKKPMAQQDRKKGNRLPLLHRRPRRGRSPLPSAGPKRLLPKLEAAGLTRFFGTKTVLQHKGRASSSLKRKRRHGRRTPASIRATPPQLPRVNAVSGRPVLPGCAECSAHPFK